MKFQVNFLLLAVAIVAVNSEKTCKISKYELKDVPDKVNCEELSSFLLGKFENFRFPHTPNFPWITLPPRFPSFPFPDFPNIPEWIRNRRPTPAPESDEDDSDKADYEECPETGWKNIAHPKSCEKYILCINGNSFPRNCAPGFHFSRAARNCMPKSEAECEEIEQVWECPEKHDPDNPVFLPNTKDCSSFYFCFMGQQIPFDCPDGHHWSIAQEDCLPEDQAKCEFDEDEEEGFEECPESGVHSIPHHKSCEKYVLCVGGNPFPRQCGSGMHFSPELRACVVPEEAGCKEKPMSCPLVDDMDELVFLPNKEDCEKYYVCFGGEQLPLRCSEGLHWSVEDENCVDKIDAGCEDFGDDDYEECPESGVKSISHPDNCEKYFFCVNGNPFLRRCTEGLHFSRESRSCMLPEKAGCEESALTCPKVDDLDNLKFLPNKEDCSKYYVCFGGDPFPLVCPEGSHWSVDNQACMDKFEAGCEDFGDGNDYEECPESGVHSIPHHKSCEKYVLCVGGNPFPRQCSPGLHFSPTTRGCVAAEDAGCKATSLTCPLEDDMENLKFLPNEEDCSMYYVCFGGEQISLSCAPGNHWSTEHNTCMAENLAGCKKIKYEQCPKEGIKQISHPSDCEMFVLCVNGARVKRNCAPGFHFSRAIRNCMPMQIAGCEDFEEGEEESEEFTCPKEDDLTNLVFLPNKENCEKYYLCHRGEQIPLSCGNGFHWSRKNENCMLPADAGCKFQTFDFDCPNPTGMESFPDPSSCQSYIVCRNGQAEQEICPDGFLWNRKMRMCTFSHLVDCQLTN